MGSSKAVTAWCTTCNKSFLVPHHFIFYQRAKDANRKGETLAAECVDCKQKRQEREGTRFMKNWPDGEVNINDIEFHK